MVISLRTRLNHHKYKIVSMVQFDLQIALEVAKYRLFVLT